MLQFQKPIQGKWLPVDGPKELNLPMTSLTVFTVKVCTTETLWRHIRNCHHNPKSEDCTTGQRRVKSSMCLTLPPPVDISKSLWTIACEMTNYEVSHVVRNEFRVGQLQTVFHLQKLPSLSMVHFPVLHIKHNHPFIWAYVDCLTLFCLAVSGDTVTLLPPDEDPVSIINQKHWAWHILSIKCLFNMAG